jgi:hypothetical protein
MSRISVRVHEAHENRYVVLSPPDKNFKIALREPGEQPSKRSVVFCNRHSHRSYAAITRAMGQQIPLR